MPRDHYQTHVCCQYCDHRKFNNERKFLVDRETVDGDFQFTPCSTITIIDHDVMFGKIRIRSKQKSMEDEFGPLTHNILPIEIWSDIVRYLEHDEKTLRRLAQTNKMTHNACIPLLYKTVYINLRGIRETLRDFPPDRYLSYVKGFSLTTCHETKSLRIRFFLFLAERRIKGMIHLEHVNLVSMQKVPHYLVEHIASLDTLHSVTIDSCTLPQVTPCLRASLQSLTLTSVEGNIVNFYNASRNSLKMLSVGGPLCPVLTKTLFAYPPPHLTKLDIRRTRNLDVEALRCNLIDKCPTITHLAIPWLGGLLGGLLVLSPSTLPHLEVLEGPLHCAIDIVPGRPVHTYHQAGGFMWSNSISPALQALQRSTSHITALRLRGGKLDFFLVTLKAIEPLMSALKVLQFDNCTIHYVRRSFSGKLFATDKSTTEFCPSTYPNTSPSVQPADIYY